MNTHDLTLYFIDRRVFLDKASSIRDALQTRSKTGRKVNITLGSMYITRRSLYSLGFPAELNRVLLLWMGKGF